MTRSEYKSLSEDSMESILRDIVMGDADAEVVCKNGCDCGCEVEPDGTCHHGCRSIMLVAGF